MAHVLRGVPVLVALVVVLSPPPSASQGVGSAPRLVVAMEAPECVEPGEPLVLSLEVSDPVGVARVAVSFAKQVYAIEVGGRRFAALTPRLAFEGAPNRPGILETVEATATGVDGVRGASVVEGVLIGGCGERTPTHDAAQLRQMMDGWKQRALTPAAAFPRGKHYKPERAAARYWEPAMQQRLPASIRASATAAHELIRAEWWKRWREAGGGQPFDWETYCPGATGIGIDGKVLRCWLALHPEVASQMYFPTIEPGTGVAVSDAYPTWPGSWKFQLDVQFLVAWLWLSSGMDFDPGDPLDPPVNRIPPTADKAWTGLDRDQAWALYLRSVAHSLALEIGGFVPWSVTSYGPDEMATIFSAHEMFSVGRHNYTEGGAPRTFDGFVCSTGHRKLTPAPVSKIFRFLVDEDLIRPTHYQSITRLLDWTGRKISHYYYDDEDYAKTDMQVHYMNWQYYGQVPTSRMIDGTVREGESVAVNWTHGCHGTSTFFTSVLRGMNIPSYTEQGWGGGPGLLDTGGHSLPLFPTIGKALSHGDDLNSFHYYFVDQLLPPPGFVSPSEIFITLDTFNDWFVVNPDEYNVGKAWRALQIEALTRDTMDRYCDDLAASVPVYQGSVYEWYSDYFSFNQLYFSMHLWQRLAEKDALHQYCSGQ